MKTLEEKKAYAAANKLQPGVGTLVAIVRGKKVLMGRRTNSNKGIPGEGLWSFPGGRCDKWQTLAENAVREVKEECGMDIDPEKLILRHVSDDMNLNRDNHFVTIGFYYTMDVQNTDEPLIVAPNEICEWRWFGFDELPANEELFYIAKRFIRTLGWRE